jgi:hypothetical protein
MSGSVEKSKGRLKIIIGVAIVVVAFLLLAPIIPVDVTYTEVESYEREAKYEVVDAKLSQGFSFSMGVYTVVKVVVKNVDKYGGTFTVTINLYTVNGLFGSKDISNYIAPGGVATFEAIFDTALGQDVRGEYIVKAPYVIDQRLVTKHKTVYKSMFELMMGRGS